MKNNVFLLARATKFVKLIATFNSRKADMEYNSQKLINNEINVT